MPLPVVVELFSKRIALIAASVLNLFFNPTSYKRHFSTNNPIELLCQSNLLRHTRIEFLTNFSLSTQVLINYVITELLSIIASENVYFPDALCFYICSIHFGNCLILDFWEMNRSHTTVLVREWYEIFWLTNWNVHLHHHICRYAFYRKFIHFSCHPVEMVIIFLWWHS